MPDKQQIGKYLIAERMAPESGRKTCHWVIESATSGALLGEVKWYGPWRCYVFAPWGWNETIFNADCLRDIAKFLADNRDTREAD